MKKKQIFIGIIVVVVILLGGFVLLNSINKTSTETDMTPSEIATYIIESQTEIKDLQSLTKSDEDFNSYITDYYMLDSSLIEDGVILYADGLEASEVAVFILNDKKDANTIKEKLTQYIENRAKVFEGYAPIQAAMIKNGEVIINGNYLVLLICEDIEKAKDAFLNCFKEGSKGSSLLDFITGKDSSNPNKDISEYDSNAVLNAWKTGDTSNLSETDKEIFNKAKNVIQEKIKDNMSEYEKELVIHDFITSWSSFDYSVFGRGDNIKEGSDTPYGVLINREAMCHGYSSTFKLFMDMLEIESIIVYGKPNSNGIEHSWNLVKLDGEWYGVDVAWDDPIGGSPTHTYFNVTSNYLRNSGIHNWDESKVPEATGTKYSYK